MEQATFCDDVSFYNWCQWTDFDEIINKYLYLLFYYTKVELVGLSSIVYTVPYFFLCKVEGSNKVDQSINQTNHFISFASEH